MARALEELIDSTRSVCEEPTKFIENKLFDTLKALKPASETWLFLKDALVLQGAKAKHSTIKLGKDRFEVIAIRDKCGNLVKEYSFVELPEGETVTLNDFEGLLKDGVFEFGCSESKPKTYFKNFLAEVKNARKQDVTREFKQDLDNSLLSMYIPFAAATGKKNFAKFVDLLQEHEPDLYDNLKAVCNIKFNSPKNIANALYDNLTEQAKQILSEERKAHKKEISELVNSPTYTKIANFTKNVVANGLIWTPLLAIIAGMAGLTATAPLVTAESKSPEKTSSRDTNLAKITNLSGTETLWDWSPDGKKLLFSSYGDLYSINSDGSGLEKIMSKPNNSVVIESAEFDASGQRIAFLINGTLYVYDIGHSAREFSSNVRTYAWEPGNGFYIAYICNDNHLFVADAADAQRILSDPSDGTKVVWLGGEDFAYVSANQKLARVSLLPSAPESGWLVDDHIDPSSDVLKDPSCMYYVSNGKLTKADFTDFGTAGTINKTTIASLDGVIKSISISPDKSKIAFYLDKNSDYSVYVINTDGSHLRRIAANLNPGGSSVSNPPAPAWNYKSDLIRFINLDSSQAATYVANADCGAPTKVIQGKSFSGVNGPAIWNPQSNTLAFALPDGDIYTQDVNVGTFCWTPSELEKIQKYAPVIIHDDRRDTSATQTYLPADPHGDNTDVQDNHENYDASPLKFSNGSMEPVYVKITEYPSQGFDVYTYIYYRAENPHWIGLEAFKHEHDVQRVHVKIDRATGNAIEVAYSQHDWIAKQKVTGSSDLTFYSEWGGHENWKFSWFGADGKGKKLDSTNTEFRPLDEIISSLDADKDGKYKTNEKNLPTNPPPKVPWLYDDVKDPQTAFGTSNAKGVLMADLHSPGDLSVIINNAVTDKNQANIPNSVWQNESVGVLGTSITDKVTLKVVGTVSGNYGLSGAFAADKPYTINGSNIPITKGEIHTYTILSWKDLADGKASINWTIQKDGKTYSRIVKASEITKTNYDDITKESQNPHHPPVGGNNTTRPADNTIIYVGSAAGATGLGIGLGAYALSRRRKQQPPMQTLPQPHIPQQELAQQQSTQDLYASDYAAREFKRN